MSLYLIFKNIAIHNKNKPAIVFKNKNYSYLDLLNLIDNLENNLTYQLHIHKHNVISVYLNDSFYSIALVYALNKIGAIIHLIDINLSVEEAIFFARKVNSRFLFMEEDLFYKNNKSLFNDLNIIVPIHSDYLIGIKKYFHDFYIKARYFKCKKPTINFDIKKMNEKAKYQGGYSMNDIALIGGNERYLEPPHICCFSNHNITCSYSNLDSIIALKREQKTFLNFNGLKVSDFINFINYPLLRLNTIYIKDSSIKRIDSYINKNKIDYVFSKEVIESKSNLQCLFLYNCFDELPNNIDYDVKYLLGCVETLGCFAYKNINEKTFKIGEEFEVKKVYKNLYNKLLDHNNCYLFLKSPVNMVGYYKDVNVNDVIFKDGYFNTNLSVMFISNDSFILNRDTNFVNNSIYYDYLKEVFLTIPGIKSIDFTNDIKNKTTKINIICHSQNKDYIKNEVKDYLKRHFKNKNIIYEIKE